MTSMNRRMIPMFHRCGVWMNASSTLSVGIVIWARS